MTTLPRALLVSDDAELTQLSTANAHIDPVSKVVSKLKGDLRLRPDRQGQLRGLLRVPDKAIMRQMEWTTRSFKARVGFDITGIDFDAFVEDNDGSLLLEAELILYPGETRDGKPVQNPLLEILPRMLKDGTKLKVARLFFRAGTQPYDAGRIEQEIQQHRLRLHPNATIVKDGVVLPCDDRQFPLRFDLMEDAMLMQGVAGFGRGVIDELQPGVRDKGTVLPPHGYRITSTQFSLGRGRRGVLAERLVDLRTGEEDPERDHGRSRLWDGGRTAGLSNERHLEWASRSWQPAPLFDDDHKPLLGTKVQIYQAPTDESRPVSVSVPSAEYHRSGYTVTHWLGSNGKTNAPERVRATLRALETGDDWGVLVGPGGLRTVAPERHYAHQVRELQKQVALYGRHGGTSCPKYPVGELGEFLNQVGNHQQRTALFCRELPSPKTVQMLVSQGVRIIFTGNVSGRDNRIYLTNNQLQHFKSLTREGGLQLYLVTPTRIRQLWNDLFVDIKKLEQLKSTDVRIGCYGASATNAEVLLQRGRFQEGLSAWMAKYPHSALVTGASKNGAMWMMNKTATDLGMLTVGIANEVFGQEVPDEELDAVMTFDRDGFEQRQALMAQITTHPVAGPGSQGTQYEIGLEQVLRKTGKTCLTPFPLVDPAGLGLRGAHLWQFMHEAQTAFNVETPTGDGRTFVLSRSPYVANMTRPVTTYEEALQWHDQFMQDPEKHWAEWGVPEAMLHVSIERTLRDSEATGLPFPSFLHNAAKHRGLL